VKYRKNWRDTVAADPSAATNLAASNASSAPFQTDEYTVAYGAQSGQPLATFNGTSYEVNPQYGNRTPVNATNSSFNQTAPNVGATAITPAASDYSTTVTYVVSGSY